jgi:uncharacterized protein YndB with AHSA1/START domain
MTAATQTKSIITERVMPHSPQKIWRALTQAPMVAEWLMKNDFKPVVGHKFRFEAKPMPGWKGYTNCEVLEVVEPSKLSYAWGDGTESDSGLKTIVTWTLTPTANGTLVRMEHSGFRPEDEMGRQAMSGGWPGILERLEKKADEA